jgi:hypothetical protein
MHVVKGTGKARPLIRWPNEEARFMGEVGVLTCGETWTTFSDCRFYRINRLLGWGSQGKEHRTFDAVSNVVLNGKTTDTFEKDVNEGLAKQDKHVEGQKENDVTKSFRTLMVSDPHFVPMITTNPASSNYAQLHNVVNQFACGAVAHPTKSIWTLMSFCKGVGSDVSQISHSWTTAVAAAAAIDATEFEAIPRTRVARMFQLVLHSFIDMSAQLAQSADRLAGSQLVIGRCTDLVVKPGESFTLSMN